MDGTQELRVGTPPIGLDHLDHWERVFLQAVQVPAA